MMTKAKGGVGRRAVLVALGGLLLAGAGAAGAAAKGSTRKGGTNAHGKGSHYVTKKKKKR